MSKKFTNTQCRYFTYELKVLGVLEALMRWQDDLMGGCEFTVITDHEALEYFKAKNHNSGRHLRWQAFFASFNCEIKYVEGCKNKVADALSHYYACPQTRTCILTTMCWQISTWIKMQRT